MSHTDKTLMSNQQTNISSYSFFLLFRSLSYKTQSTMSYGLSNPSYQGESVRFTPPSRLQQTQGQVDEVTGIMKDNLKKVLDRGEKLDDLEQKSDTLNEGSRQFAIHAHKLKKKFWWKNCRMWIILGSIVAIIIIIIIVVVVLKTKK